jgi:hypothetical protein
VSICACSGLRTTVPVGDSAYGIVSVLQSNLPALAALTGASEALIFSELGGAMKYGLLASLRRTGFGLPGPAQSTYLGSKFPLASASPTPSLCPPSHGGAAAAAAASASEVPLSLPPLLLHPLPPETEVGSAPAPQLLLESLVLLIKTYCAPVSTRRMPTELEPPLPSSVLLKLPPPPPPLSSFPAG